MSIPASADDADIVIGDALIAANDVLTALRASQARVRELEGLCFKGGNHIHECNIALGRWRYSKPTMPETIAHVVELLDFYRDRQSDTPEADTAP